MTPFDSIAHSFSTVAIGGFSTHDQSMAYFDNPMIIIITTFFMFISGINFALHFFCWRRHEAKHYLADPECMFYFYLMFIACIIVCAYLFWSGTYGLTDALLHGTFQVVSIATTTGYATANFSAWPSFVPFLLMFLAFVGGCAGSTGGGIKVIRVMLICKQGLRELRQLIHPQAVIPVKLKKRSVSDRVLAAVWSFFAVYVICFMTILTALLVTGMDYLSAFSATAASINNLGPGLGSVAAHYGDIENSAKWILCFSMLLGRLEIFTLLVLLTPAFWKR
jgi:trk system potassium uptake protein TrkH